MLHDYQTKYQVRKRHGGYEIRSILCDMFGVEVDRIWLPQWFPTKPEAEQEVVRLKSV